MLTLRPASLDQITQLGHDLWPVQQLAGVGLVDLLTEEAISPHLRERILREQRVLYEAAH